MADRWMDERDRRWRDRDWRRSEDLDRPGGYAGEGYYPREDRSFGGEEKDLGARRSGPDRDRVFGEYDTGASYGRGPSGRSGGRFYGEGEGRHAHGGDWQDRDYGGVSPAMAHGEYELDRGRSPSPRFERQDYTRGGRYYGDDERAPIYREEWGQGGVDYASAPRGYDAGRGGRSGGAYGGTYGGAGGDYGYRARPAYGGQASGGTGGYDYERGYGDGGRRDFRHGDHDRGWGDGGETGDRVGDFFYKAGRKVREWFRGDDLMHDGDHDRGYQTDFGRERRYFPEERGYRGMGPKGYRRSDERISEDAHERLADDSWIDASNIDIKVKDGEVTLSGQVDNRESKHRAERLVEDISGVSHVQNNLRVMANPLTGSGRGFGDSAAEAQMKQDSGNGANGSDESAATRSTTRRT